MRNLPFDICRLLSIIVQGRLRGWHVSWDTLRALSVIKEEMLDPRTGLFDSSTSGDTVCA
jgi:hypothetical protein